MATTELIYSYDKPSNSYIVTGLKSIVNGKVEIPSTYSDGTHGGLSVTSIYNSAFYNCISLQSVTIPSSIAIIGAYAFAYCPNLESVVIGNGVVDIGERVFVGCQKLTSITIPNSVTRIGGYAFNSCTSLQSVTISSGVTSIGYDAFDNCPSLNDVYITDIAKWCGISFGSHYSNPLYYADNLYLNGELVTDLVIPDGVTTIPTRAFSCNSLVSITIPNSVTSIGSDAFRDCSSLTSVGIPNSVTLIGYAAFYGCIGLTSISIPNSVTGISSSTFYNCTGLTSVTIPNSILRIDEFAFFDCKSLTSITIPNSVTSIGDRAFYDCRGLTSVTIGNSVKSIGKMAFLGCQKLTSITIPNSVTSIGDNAFYNCTGLTGVTIPDSVTSIGYGPFGTCFSLTSIIVDKNNANYKSTNGNLYTKDGKTLIQYAAGKTDTSFAIPNGVTNIGGDAFSGSNLTYVTIPSGVTSIGDWAFNDCLNLTSITIPDSVISIGNYAFALCESLTSIIIPNGVTSIGESTFAYCSSLASVVIPNSVTHINDEVFEYCTSLTSIVIGNGVISIGDWAFYGCSKLTSVVIPDSMTSIGYRAFYNCASLQSITIPNSITTIGSQAFRRCDLKNIYFTGSKEVWDSYKSWSTDLASESVNLYNAIHDCDFLAFTFNGHHSLLDLNIIRTSDGDRYNQDLTPQIKEATAENPGGDGMYYFKTNYPSRQFNISFAFDSLTDQQIRKLKQVFSVRELCDLIFDEEPYKVWSAKVTGTPTIKYVPFDNRDGQRVYRGEGSVQFIAYWPFAHTPNTDTKISKKFRASGTFEKNGLLFNNYDEWLYPTKNQWKLTSGLKESGSVEAGENCGDLPAPFVLSKSGITDANTTFAITDKLYIKTLDVVYELEWDSKTGVVSGLSSASAAESTRAPVPVEGNTVGGIPVDGCSPTLNGATLTYQYWYY